jgi:hypothetical protein
MALQDLLARCPRCHVPVLLTYGEASYRNLAIFEAVPWSPLDEEPEEGRDRMTPAGLRRWEALLPYKLAIAYIDLERGTWQLAMVRSNEKLRPGMPLWKPHNCLEEVGDDGHVEPAATFTPQDQPVVRTRERVVAVDGGQRGGPVADGGVRRRRARFGRAHPGEVR